MSVPLSPLSQTLEEDREAVDPKYVRQGINYINQNAW